jgi:hypothetical protein
MKIHLFWKGMAIAILTVLLIAAYRTTDSKSVLPVKEKQCSQQKDTYPKVKPSKSTGESIIFDSMSDNLLFIHM